MTKIFCASKRKSNNAGKVKQRTETKQDCSDLGTKQREVKAYLFHAKEINLSHRTVFNLFFRNKFFSLEMPVQTEQMCLLMLHSLQPPLVHPHNPSVWEKFEATPPTDLSLPIREKQILTGN